MIRLPGAGERFGRYQLVSKLGQGGMGVVYAARDTSLGRDVALKLVAPQHASDEGFRLRFSHEAATLARLESPRIVRIYDYGEQDGVLFLVTQLVEGGDLSALIRRTGPLSPGQAVGVVVQVLEGLVDAHAVNVVHRDVKPANVLLRGSGSDLEAFLCDFGIATVPGAELSRTGTLAGSLPYMAPERHQGVEAGAGGDVYAAGCLLWFALTGAAPYAGTDVEMAMAHLQAPIRQLPGKDKFSSAMNEVLRVAMAKDPRKRYPSAMAMLTDLLKVGALAPDAVALPGNTSLRQELNLGVSARRRYLPAAVAALATAAVLVSTLLVGGAIGGPKQDPTRAGALSLPSGASGTGDGDVLGSDELKLREDPTQDDPGGSRNEGAAPGGDVGDRVQGGEEGASGEPTTTLRPEAKGSAGTTRSSAPKPGTSSSTSRAPATTAPPPKPITCWNGVKAYRIADCPRPTTRKGATWIFPVLGRLECRKVSFGNAAEAWRCPYGNSNHITVARWHNRDRAVSYYRSYISINYQRSAWTVDGVTRGSRFIGRRKVDGNVRYTNVKMYSALPWTVSVDASSSDARARGVDKVGWTRRGDHLKGHPTG
ncbi:MAG TPA: serine/threonine-protein kinase [Nocardioides sp.]